MLICEVCDERLNGPKLDLGFYPLCDDLFDDDQSIYAEKYHQEIQLCKNCLTAHQLHPVKKELLFKPSYHYRSSLTNDVVSGMGELVNSVLKFGEFDQSTGICVLDIGCNDGSLLSEFSKKINTFSIGVDPTDSVTQNSAKLNAAYQEFFTRESAMKIRNNHGFPDVITFTNVFAHIEDLNELLQALKILIGPSTIVVIENHYLGSILDRNQFDTFYHEHPRTYSAESFVHIARKLELNLNLFEFPKRYGGNIRVILSRSRNKISKNELPKEEIFTSRFAELQSIFNEWVSNSATVLKSLLLDGPILGKSLPGRAVMLIEALKINDAQMPIIYERENSPKVGFFVPGTKIRIDSDLNFKVADAKRIIVWAWHISEEICDYLESIGFKGEVWVPLPEFRLYKKIE